MFPAKDLIRTFAHRIPISLDLRCSGLIILLRREAIFIGFLPISKRRVLQIFATLTKESLHTIVLKIQAIQMRARRGIFVLKSAIEVVAVAVEVFFLL